MTPTAKKRIDEELRCFTSRNFTLPAECRNPDQIRFYIEELCNKIQELERRFNYVPPWAYQLLSQYKAKQTMLLHSRFRTAYR